MCCLDAGQPECPTREPGEGRLTSFGVVEDLADVGDDILQCLILFRAEFLVHCLETHGMLDGLVVVGKGSLEALVSSVPSVTSMVCTRLVWELHERIRQLFSTERKSVTVRAASSDPSRQMLKE